MERDGREARREPVWEAETEKCKETLVCTMHLVYRNKVCNAALTSMLNSIPRNKKKEV